MEDFCIKYTLNIHRPVAVVVVEAVESGHHYSYCILRAADVGAAGRILVSEHHLGERLAVALGNIDVPHFDGGTARRGTHSAAVVEFVVRLYADGYHRPGTETVDAELVVPASGKIYAVGDVALLTQGCGGTARKAGSRLALADNQLYGVLLAETAFLGGVPVAVDKEDVRLQAFHILGKVHDAAAGIDKGILDVTYGLDHIKAFAFGVDGLAVLEVADGLVGTDADVEVAVSGCLFEEGHMSGVEHVVATRHKYFLSHGMGLFAICGKSGFLGLAAEYIGCLVGSEAHRFDHKFGTVE